MADHSHAKADIALSLFFLILTVALHCLPTGFEERVNEAAVRCRGEIIRADDSLVHQYGIVRTGIQNLDVKLLDGPFAGRVVDASNEILGKLEIDKIFRPGDTAFMVLSVVDGRVVHAHAQDHYRLDAQLLLFAVFALALLAYAGWSGVKALLSFVFSAYVIWKVLVPAFLRGHDPVLVSLGVTAAVMAATLFLVGGAGRTALTAYLGSLLGVGAACGLAFLFAGPFNLSGAVVPYSETVLYSGFPYLDLTRIFLATIFIAASGAIMDLAMDVAAHMRELACQRPSLSRRELIGSGLRVGRAVVGTMTTTLLLAYSGGYVTLLMVFMAQGVPVRGVFNMSYVSAEVLSTLAGSCGLVLAAPATALVGGALLGGRQARVGRQAECGATEEE